jgi:uracil-DNA glycosylase
MLASYPPMTDNPSSSELCAIAARIRNCRICRDAPQGVPLPHEPRPVLRVSTTARLLVASQAPGTKVHLTGLSFNDASGDRLRQWMGISRDDFYDEAKVAIVPMGFCFPGQAPGKADLPPRRECREAWHDGLLRLLPQLECILAIGRFAQAYHFARVGRPLPKSFTVDATVHRYAELAGANPRIIPLPHPSWRNTGWLRRNPWFEAELLPRLRSEVARAIQ